MSPLTKNRLLWYLKAQVGILAFPFGLCLFGEAVIDKLSNRPWFWSGTLSLIVINLGLGLMIESGLTAGFPRSAPEENKKT
ncbi:MAG: hypothetical protein ACK4QL_11330 [Pseudanabaenaceae cyanobacterium]